MTASPLSISDLDTIKEQFERDGLFHVRGLLSEEEADHYARLIDEKLVTHGTGQRFMSNGPNEFPEFWPLITHPKLVEVLRHVLGPDLRYVQAGDLHANHNAHHWHRDLALKHSDMPVAHDDTETPFRIIKVGIYMDPGASAYAMVPRCLTSPMKRYFGIDLYEDPFLLQDNGAELARAEGLEPPILFRPNKGDMVAMDARLLHAGCYVDPDSGKPRRENPRPKKNVWLVYGVDNDWTRKLHFFYRYVRKDLIYRPMAEGLVALLKETGLLLSGMDTPSPEVLAWLRENTIMPPHLERDDTPYGVVGSPGWYAAIAADFEKAGYAFAAARCYRAAHELSLGPLTSSDAAATDTSAALLARRSGGEARRLKRQASRYLARAGLNTARYGDKERAGAELDQASALNPLNLVAWWARLTL